MKTKAFIQDSRVFGKRALVPRGQREAANRGFIGKVALVALVLILVAAGGFALHVKGKMSQIDGLLPKIAQEVTANSTAAAPTEEKDASPARPSVSGPTADAQASAPDAAANTLPAVAPASTPSGPRTAPPGMVYLGRRVMVTKDTGILSFARGTLLVVQSKSGGKIRGSIRGVPIEIAEKDALATIEESELVPVVSKK